MKSITMRRKDGTGAKIRIFVISSCTRDKDNISKKTPQNRSDALVEPFLRKFCGSSYQPAKNNVNNHNKKCNFLIQAYGCGRHDCLSGTLCVGDS